MFTKLLLLVIGTAYPSFEHILACFPANEFQVRVVDADTKKPISVRMSIRNSRGALIKQRGIPFHAGHFCFFGTHNFKLPRGIYSYTIEKGPEYRTVSGQFEIKRGSNDGVSVTVPRFTRLADRGWWSGDLAIIRRLEDLPILMDSNALNFANYIFQSSSKPENAQPLPKKALKRINDELSFCQTGIHDQRAGGSLLFVNSDKQFALAPEGSILPLQLPERVSNDPSVVILDSAAAWDLPVLLAESRLQANRKLDGIAIAGGWLTSGKPRRQKKDQRPPPSSTEDHSLARWHNQIYFHVLNAGFKIPPVALSFSGDSTNPVGYNRTYVHTGQKFTAEKWLENLKKGHVVVTNSPVMNVRFNGLLPGETLLVDEGKSIEIEPTLTLSLKEKADYLEIIRNGLVAKDISLDEYAKSRGRLPKLTFTQSGWMAVRVVIRNNESYRFAMSGPIYVQVGNQQPAQRKSAEFFLKWIIERGKMIRSSDAENKEEALERMRPAYEYWKKRAESEE